MRHVLLVAIAILLGSCSSGGSKPKLSAQSAEQTAAKPMEPRGPVETETQVEMVNVNMHVDPVLILHVRRLTGRFVPTRKG